MPPRSKNGFRFGSMTLSTSPAALSAWSAAVSKSSLLKSQVGVVEDDVLEELDGLGNRPWSCQRIPHQLASGLQRRKDLLPSRWRHGRRVDPARRFDLRRGQARRLVGAGALQDLRVEPALPRIVDQAILEAVGGVAGVDRRAMDGRVLGRGNVARRAAVNGVRHPQLRDQLMGSMVDRGSGDDAVVVGRVAQRFHQPCRPPVEQPFQ